MSKSTVFTNKLVDKCRRGNERACSELREYRKFLEERLKIGEYLLTSNFFAIRMILIVEKLIISILSISLLVILFIVLTLMTFRIYKLSKYIKDLYEILGDSVMPWKIDPLVIGILIGGTILTIIGILTALGIV